MALETTPSAEGPISMDQGLALMRAAREAPVAAAETPPAAAVADDPADAPAKDEENEESPADPPADDTDGEPDGANADGEAEPVEPAKPAIDAPHWWTAKAKASFAELPAELQSVVLEQDRSGQGAVTKAQQKAAEAAKLAETARSEAAAKTTELTQFLERVTTVLPQVEQSLKSRWDNVDWVRWANEDPAAYIAGKAQFDAETQQLKQLSEAKQTAAAEVEKAAADSAQAARAEWAKAEGLKLAELVPDFTDPKLGKSRMDETIAFAKAAGYSDAQIQGADAGQFKMAYDAMRWAKAQAAIKAAAPAPKTPARPGARPAAAQATTQTQRSRADALAQLNKSGSVDDAVRALQAQRRKG